MEAWLEGYRNDASIFNLKVLCQQITLDLKRELISFKRKKKTIRGMWRKHLDLGSLMSCEVVSYGWQNRLCYSNNVSYFLFEKYKKSVSCLWENTYNFFNFHSYHCNVERYVEKSLGPHTHNLAVLFNYLMCFKFTQFPLMLPNDGSMSEEVWLQSWGRG